MKESYFFLTRDAYLIALRRMAEKWEYQKTGIWPPPLHPSYDQCWVKVQ